MADPPDGAAPPKKRSFFKKRAPVKPEAENDDIFSHSKNFEAIVAQQAKRRQEEKEKAEAERRRKAGEERERKRRKVSSEEEDDSIKREAGRSFSPSASAVRNVQNGKARSRTPHSPKLSVSPTPPRDTLSKRYDSLTKSAKAAAVPKKENTVIDLGDSDSDSDLDSGTRVDIKIQTGLHSKPSTEAARRRHSSSPIQEVEDPELAALAAQARARAKERAEDTASPANPEPKRSAVVQLFITSVIPNTKTLMIKTWSNSQLDRALEAWTRKNFPNDPPTIFLTWKRHRLFDTTLVERCGLSFDDHGNVLMADNPDIWDENNSPKIHLEAWTEEAFREHKQREAEEAEAARKAEEPSPEPSPEPPEEPDKPTIGLFLKAKGEKEFRIKVRKNTTFAHLAHAYKQSLDINTDQPLTLMFDGERLRPMDTVADAEIEDMDRLDIVFN